MRHPAFLIVACLTTFTASAEGTPSFRPADVKKQCAVVKKSALMLQEVASDYALVGLEVEQMNLAVALGDFSGARAQKRALIRKLRALGEAVDQTVEAAIYLAQLGEHVQMLPPDQARKLRPYMTECIEVIEANKAASPSAPSAEEEDGEPMEDGGFVD